LRDRPLTERRQALERIFGRTRSPILRISESVRGDGRALYKRALESGWEGLIAKRTDSRYKSGKRTPDWRKMKIVHEQEFVIAGWTEPRHSRAYFGALLLGVFEKGQLVYVGHTGTGFNEAELARLMKLLKPLETKECPFRERPKTNERPHWVKPALVAQIKFTEWTADGKLRHPVYLGLRDDKKPEEVIREPVSRVHAGSTARPAADGTAHLKAGTTSDRKTVGSKADSTSDRAPQKADTTYDRKKGGTGVVSGFSRNDINALLEQLRDLEQSRRDGTIDLPDGDRLSVSNLHKVFWPKHKLTKGDLLRYYVEAAPFILPAIADRPLTMKRYPNGIDKPPFYQHRAPDQVPPNVRVEHVPGEKTVPARFIGGDLKTLLYMTQLAAISQDPWFSRVTSPDITDHAALDLDPSEGVPFARVLDVARWIRDELDHIGAMGVPKTSGADGLHIYIPLPPGTPYEAGLIFCQIIATVVAQKHPRVATVERSVRARGARVYIDCLQNIQGKTLASAYSARASEYAGVSTPLTWHEVDDGVTREDFTIRTTPARLGQVGDLWTALRTSKGVDLSSVSKYTDSVSGTGGMDRNGGKGRLGRKGGNSGKSGKGE
jgi:bifunctional non-homologous end joining protein LigD